MEFPKPKKCVPVNKNRMRAHSLEGERVTNKAEFQADNTCRSTESMDMELRDEDFIDCDDEDEQEGMNEKKSNVPGVSGNVNGTPIQCTDGDGNTSPSVKEEINMLYRCLPEIANHFTIIKMIGEGTFSSVFLAKLRHHPEIDQMFALKHIIPTSHPCRIENELRCLLNIGGQDNVMGVKLCVRNKDHVVIVMPYFAHQKFQDYLFQMPLEEAREYMRNLLIALRRVHQFNVIHRDIKPSNFLYNPDTKEYALVDFGLATGPLLTDPAKVTGDRHSHSSASLHVKLGAAAVVRSRSREPLSPRKMEVGEKNQSNVIKTKTDLARADDKNKKEACAGKMFAPSVTGALALDRQLSGDPCSCFGKPMICEVCVARSMQIAPRAGTAGFRAPEVLLKSPQQDTAVDMWAAGVIFLSLLSARYPFFKANDDLGFLAQIISLVGSDSCVQAAKSFGKQLTLSEFIMPVDLETACKKLRHIQMSARNLSSPASGGGPAMDSWSHVPSHAFQLLASLLDPNPKTRISAEAALNHPFFTSASSSTLSSSTPSSSLSSFKKEEGDVETGS